MSNYATNGEFQRAIGCGKSTFSRYIRRENWPVSRIPPWSAADLVTVQNWRAKLQEDRAMWIREAMAERAGIEPDVDCPGRRVTVEDLLNPDTPFGKLAAWIGPARWATLTIAELETLARHLTCGIALAMFEGAEKTGEKGMLKRAPASYYHELFEAAGADRTCEILNNVAHDFFRQRFGDSYDKPAAKGVKTKRSK